MTVSSLVHRSPTEWSVSERDLEISAMRRSRPTIALEPWGEGGGDSTFHESQFTCVQL